MLFFDLLFVVIVYIKKTIIILTKRLQILGITKIQNNRKNKIWINLNNIKKTQRIPYSGNDRFLVLPNKIWI